ncbi:phosphorylase family protein [Flavivirga algicola]|uniref:Nucleoside phosphorylase n=1 Tax=Flavivirga algicola TaxID=2729136 RepID=A0ABX1RSY7_9FLAO|nr:hypothetical protein [Flavivirga algicola]NMH86667.1 nucleoside phosphorylase [Flavivirga algicola]
MSFNFKDSNFYNENTILDISMIVDWNKKRRKYNFDKLPLTAIISLDKNLLSRKVRFVSKKAKGLVGNNYIINNNFMYASNFGNGAPALIGHLEELRCLGVENFIFIGLGGSLIFNESRNNSFILKNTFSTSGCTTLYSMKDSFKPIKNEWYNNLKSKLNLAETIGWSTDAPFRETPSLLNYYREKKVTHVDMESASIYAFSEFYKLNAMCIIVSADDLTNNRWTPPQNVDKLNNIINSIITICSKT